MGDAVACEEAPDPGGRLERSAEAADPEGERLEAARTRFRAAWRARSAQQERRVALTRRRAERVSEAAGWGGTAALLVYLLVSAVMLSAPALQERLRLLLLYGLAGCGGFYLLARGTAALLRWIAERLEAREIRSL